ncbi:MAG: FKBP-type peptidyl-prolyl cis-trans isomerase [Chitinophagaceae bacterium]|nr:FKBP-type peptidyl-prolyl cis-trans isomerase [Chitinophagaceae bacterium]
MQKKYVLIAFLFFLSFGTVAQNTGKQPAKPVSPAGPLLKNITDSVSYAVGISIANFYKQQGIKTINRNLLMSAIQDVMNGKKTLMTEEQANQVLNRYMFMIQEQKAKVRLDSGKAFLENNKKRSGVETTPSGLQYEVLIQGGGIKPGPTDSVTCHYVGKLINGTEFDNSYKRGQPITFPLNGVIKGWTEGLQLMPEGSKYIFYIPPDLGYGNFDYGPIPGGSVLIFEVDLLKVTKAKNEN